MSGVERLIPPISLDTPKGKALAYFMSFGSVDQDIIWVCFIESTRECWSFRNPEIRLSRNYTMGIGRKPGEEFPMRPAARQSATSNSIEQSHQLAFSFDGVS